MKKNTRSRSAKVLIYILGCSFGLVGLIIASGSYLFLHLSDHQLRIKRFLEQTSGWKVDFKQLNTGFNHNWQPEILIKDFSLASANAKLPFIKIKQLQIAVAYGSLAQRQPIFSQVAIKGSQLNLEYSANGDLLLNQQRLTNLEATESSPNFDWQELLLKQQRIQLSSIGLVVLDSKHRMLPLSIEQLKLDWLNSPGDQHSLLTSAKINGSARQLSAKWHGSGISDFSKWRSGEIKLKNLDQQGFQLAVNCQVNDGQLVFLRSNFNSNQQLIHLTADKQQDLKELSGALAIEQQKNEDYTVSATSLVLNTGYGYVLKNADISGEYTPNQGGQIHLNNINLLGLNSLIKFSQSGNKLNLSGSIDDFKLAWSGALNSLHSVRINSRFSKLAIASSESNIPSLNNINGSINSGESSGSLQLSLSDSKLSYPKQLKQSINIQHLQTTLSWQLESANLSKLAWTASSIQTADFKLTTTGNYQPNSESLQLQARLERFNLKGIVNYLPKESAKAVINYLNQSQISGSFSNGNLSINGAANKIPFKQGGGQLNFDALLSDAGLKFAPEWGALSHLNGKLSLRNQQLELKINSGMAGKNLIQATSLKIADITDPNGSLNLQAYTSGATENFLEYLESSPFQKQIQQIYALVTAGGSSAVKIGLKLPFANPENLVLNGQYQVKDNFLNLAESKLIVESINGVLNFSATGVQKSLISANALGSQLELNIHNNSEITLSSPNLNYTRLAELLSPQASQVIYGAAPTELSFNRNNWLIQSNLQGVSIDGVAPLVKTAAESKDLTIHLQSATSTPGTDVAVNYADVLFAKAKLTEDMQLAKLKVALGTPNYQLHNEVESAPITIKANLIDTPILDWITLLNKFVPPTTSKNNRVAKSAVDESALSITPPPATRSAGESTMAGHATMYPIQLEVNSNAFWLKNYNLDRGTLNLWIESAGKITIGIHTPDISGNLFYSTESRAVDIRLNKLLYSSANFNAEGRKLAPTESAAIASTSAYPRSAEPPPMPESQPLGLNTESQELIPAPNLPVASSNDQEIASIKIAIANLYYQNHYLGQFSSNVYPEDGSLYVESATLSNQAGQIRFNLADQCLNCGESRETIVLLLNSDINDFGLFVNKLDLGDSFNKGKGHLDLALRYNGGFANFDSKKTYTSAKLDIKDVELTHVKPGLFGALLGVVTMKSAFAGVSSITSFATTGTVNMNSLFGNTLVFDSLKASVRIKQDDLKIVNLNMDGGMVDIFTFGNVYLESNTIDSYLKVEPKVGTTLATTVGVVTLNPIIGFMVYFGGELLGNPQNKALAVSYHIQGNFESPTMTKTDISKQIFENVGSSINIFK